MMVGKGKEVVEKRKKEPRPLFALAFALFKRAKQKKLKKNWQPGGNFLYIGKVKSCQFILNKVNFHSKKVQAE